MAQGKAIKTLKLLLFAATVPISTMVQTAKSFKVTCMALAMLVTGKAATEVANGGFNGATQLAGLVDPPPLSALMGLGSPGGADCFGEEDLDQVLPTTDNPSPLSAQGPGSLGGGATTPAN